MPRPGARTSTSRLQKPNNPLADHAPLAGSGRERPDDAPSGWKRGLPTFGGPRKRDGASPLHEPKGGIYQRARINDVNGNVILPLICQQQAV